MAKHLPFHLDLTPSKLKPSTRVAAVVAACLLVVGGVGWWHIDAYYQNRIYPNVFIGETAVGGLTRDEASTKLPSPTPPSTVLMLMAGEQNLASNSAELGVYYNFEQALSEAESYGKTGPWWRQLIAPLQLQFKTQTIEPKLVYEPALLENFVQTFKAQIDQPDQPATAELKTTNQPKSLSIFPGKEGRELELEATVQKLARLSPTESHTVEVTLSPVGRTLTAEEQSAAASRSAQFVGKKFIFTHPEKVLTLNDQDLVSLLSFDQPYNDSAISTLLENWNKEVVREPSDAVFEYNPDTLEVSKFIPHRNGLQLDAEKTKNELLSALNAVESADVTTTPSVETRLELALKVKPPTHSLAGTNQLGINEMIGWGDSEYDHSIPSRIHNVALTTTKITNHIVKPGEEFSFNKALGDVSAATGFQPAYVIKNGQTVLGDGGGVCQVSTTLFRALLNAGMPITKRKAHSYRVSYYELNQKPGLDATVYSGDVDLRFVNDTSQHILIHAEADSKNLYMKVELYGTSDGRKGEILNHRVWDARPAPAPVYIPDTTIPPGTLKQVDWAASGIRASFTYKVTGKDGQVIREQEFASNYQPWSAKYLQGVAP